MRVLGFVCRVAAVVVSGAAAPVWAEPAVAAAWTLPASLQVALTREPSVLGRLAARQAADFEREGADWARYPTPALEVAKPSDRGLVTTARIDQPLWTGGRITAGIEAAGHRFDAADAAVLESRRDVALKVVAAWVDALRAQARLARLTDSVAEHEKLVELISRRVAQEVSPAVDRDFARARLLQVQNDASAARQALRAALSQLSQLVGEDVSAVAGELEAEPPFRLERDQALTASLAHAPTLKKLAAEREAAGRDVDARRAALMPSVLLRLERYDNSLTSSGGADQRALVVLSAQPGAGLSALAGVSAAQAKVEAARYALEAARQAVVTQVRQDWDELTTARLRAATAIETRVVTAEVFHSYTRQYAAGRKTWIEVMNAVRESSQADVAVIDIQAQALAASWRLAILTGEGAFLHDR